MDSSVSRQGRGFNPGFSIFDQLSYSDRSLPFGRLLSADRLRQRFAEKDALFGYGENDLWNTGLTLWAFVGQVLQDGKQRSCHAAITHATRYLLEQGLRPPDPSIRQTLGLCNLLHIARNEVGNRPGRIEPRVVKRRPKPYPLMTQPRQAYKQALQATAPLQKRR